MAKLYPISQCRHGKQKATTVAEIRAMFQFDPSLKPFYSSPEDPYTVFPIEDESHVVLIRPGLQFNFGIPNWES